jgi:nucleoside-diphosphate-sugar epimerase
MRILITGGAGCLGSNLTGHWYSGGHDMLVIDNFVTGWPERVPALPRLELVEGTIADRDLVRRTVDLFRPTHVVHLAASYKDPTDWREDVKTNVLGMINLVEAAHEFGVVRFVNFQTVLCYGRPSKNPIPIDHPLAPFTSYAISKVAGEQYLASSALSWISLRLANVTGPHLAIGPIPTFYKRLRARQPCFCTDAVRDFLDMSDFISAVDLAMAKTGVVGTFNVATGRGRSIKDIYDLVREHLGLAPNPAVKIVPVGSDDVREVVPDPSSAVEMLGWTPKVDFRTTMQRMLEWYDAHGVTEIHSHLAHDGRDGQQVSHAAG